VFGMHEDKWQRFLLREQLLKDEEYVRNVLGEACVGNNELMLQEQLLLESFFEKVKGLAGKGKSTFSVISKIYKDPSKIRMFSGFIDDNIIRPAFKSIKEKIEKIQDLIKKQKDDMFVKPLYSLLEIFNDRVNKTYNSIKAVAEPWKKTMVAMAFAAALGYLKEKIFDMIPITKTLEDIFNFFKDEVVGFLKDKLGEQFVDATIGVLSGGVTTFISWVTKIVGNVSFMYDILEPAIEPFLKGAISLSKFEEVYKKPIY
jgi:hypothetical protein